MDRERFPVELFLLAGKTDGSGSESEKWLPIWMHMTDTAGIMDMLVRKWLPKSAVRAAGFQNADEAVFRKLCKFIAYVHDIGKFTPVFASKIYAKLPEMAEKVCIVPEVNELKSSEKTPHALAGEVILQKFGCPEEVSIIVGAHHGKPQSLQDTVDNIRYQIKMYPSNYYGPKGKKFPDKWENIWNSWIRYALQETGFASFAELPALSMEAQVILTGLLIMSDWIASNPKYFPLLELDEEGNGLCYPTRVASAWKKLQFPDLWEPKCFSMDDTYFKECFGFLPNEVQKNVISAVNDSRIPGIYILEAQMGVGKTEAALASAEVLAKKYDDGGIFFGLPTQATANGIFKRLEDWAFSQSDETVHALRLAHGMAELNSDYQELLEGTAVIDENDGNGKLIAHEWFEGRKTALLANFVIGTVDQVLMAALKQKHVMLRHLGLCGKVVIIDECHAYDAYMNQYLDRALNWLGAYQIPVIMLSATLPAERRKELIYAYLYNIDTGKNAASERWEKNREYPLLTWTEGNKINQKGIKIHGERKKVKINFIQDDEVILSLQEILNYGGCVGVIVNTVKRAQGFADLLRRKFKKAEVIVFHAQFTMSDRAEKEQLLMERIGKKSTLKDRNRVIVVGTQVLEQSLDIDFDYLVTDLCPMDLLLQRIGRLHRHQRRRPEWLREPCCCVIEGEGESLEDGSCFIYGEWLLRRTRELLPETIMLPDDIPQLVQDTYKKPDEMLQNQAWKEYTNSLEKKKREAKEFCVAAPKPKGRFKSHYLTGWLDADLEGDDTKARAAVRDGDSSVEVILMRKLSDGKIGFLSSRYCDETVDATHVPDSDTCRRIAKQRIRLPHVVFRKTDEIIKELQMRNCKECLEWQQSKLLKGELILLLDEKCSVELCGYRLTYHESDGLVCVKEV